MSSNLRDDFPDLGDLPPSRDLKIINARLLDLRNKAQNWIVGPGVGSLYKLETLPECYAVAWHCFMFDPTIGGPHVYRDKVWEKGRVALKREALLELWNSADGRFLHSERNDDGRDPHYARYTWAGSVLSLSGQPIPRALNAETDLRDGAAETIGMSEGHLRKARMKIAMITESKAQNRVIRELLGISQSYTEEQVAWPFILMKLIFVPDMKDPVTRLLVTANAIGAANAVFGGPTGAELMKALIAAQTPASDPTPQLPPAKTPQLGAGTPPAAEPTPHPAEPAALPFELVQPEVKPAATPVTIATLEDYVKLEATCANGKATPEMVIALNDLQKRFPQMKVNVPVEQWEPAHRRIYVERVLALGKKTG